MQMFGFKPSIEAAQVLGFEQGNFWPNDNNPTGRFDHKVVTSLETEFLSSNLADTLKKLWEHSDVTPKC